MLQRVTGTCTTLHRTELYHNILNCTLLYATVPHLQEIPEVLVADLQLVED